MATLSDLGLSLLQQSKEFSIGPNFSLQGPAIDDSGSGTKLLSIDEFIHILPFEAFDRDPLGGVYGSRPSVTEPNPAFLPGSANPNWGVADWFYPDQTSELPQMELDLETSVDPTYETFYLRRIATVLKIDPYQLKVVATRAGGAPGPDPIPTLIRAGSLSVVRALSRAAINNVDAAGAAMTDYRMLGLAKYYDDQFGGAGADPQVIKSVSSSEVVKEVRQLMRQVAPSGDGFGVGPNALLMSKRTRDFVISMERTTGISPTFLPDPRFGGELRYHLDGVPVYVGPVREDEDASGSEPAFLESSASPYQYNYSSIYAMRLGGASGVRMLHFGGDSANYGLQVEAIAPNSGSAWLGYRIHGHYTLFIPERQSCARLWGVDISTEVA